jgi:hypothetical protein
LQAREFLKKRVRSILQLHQAVDLLSAEVALRAEESRADWF